MRIAATIVLLVCTEFIGAQVLYPQGVLTSQPAPILREGTFLLRKTGQVTRTADGKAWQFALEVEPSAPAWPSMTILPNLQLAEMERTLKDSPSSAKFIVTGMITRFDRNDGTPANGLLVEAVSTGEAILAADRIAPAPSTQPLGSLPPGQMLDRMLKPTTQASARPLRPTSAPGRDTTSGNAAVGPGASVLTVVREGSFLVDRTGRLTRAGDGQSWEFSFDSDARTMKDAPVVILPNLKLMLMEQAVKGSNRDLRFRITGMVTEYNGRNHILLEKFVVVPDVVQQF